jgi:hypothetical protein
MSGVVETARPDTRGRGPLIVDLAQNAFKFGICE